MPKKSVREMKKWELRHYSLEAKMFRSVIKMAIVIGAMEGVKYREYEFQMEPGAKLFVYTDGVPEATNASEELFGTDRMIEALNSDPDAAPQDILHNVRKAVDEFTGDAEQFDDLTMLCMEYCGAIHGE